MLELRGMTEAQMVESVEHLAAQPEIRGTYAMQTRSCTGPAWHIPLDLGRVTFVVLATTTSSGASATGTPCPPPAALQQIINAFDGVSQKLLQEAAVLRPSLRPYLVKHPASFIMRGPSAHRPPPGAAVTDAEPSGEVDGSEPGINKKRGPKTLQHLVSQAKKAHVPPPGFQWPERDPPELAALAAPDGAPAGEKTRVVGACVLQALRDLPGGCFVADSAKVPAGPLVPDAIVPHSATAAPPIIGWRRRTGVEVRHLLPNESLAAMGWPCEARLCFMSVAASRRAVAWASPAGPWLAILGAAAAAS